MTIEYMHWQQNIVKHFCVKRHLTTKDKTFVTGFYTSPNKALFINRVAYFTLF